MLRVSPSAVSQQLALLEREVGLVLVDRSRRGGQRRLQLTDVGRRLAVHAERLEQVLRDAEAEVEPLHERATGVVTIAVFFTVLRGFAGRAVEELAGTHPGLLPRVVEVEDQAVAGEVLSGRVDVALVDHDAGGGRRTPRGLRYEPLTDDPFHLALPAAWPAFDDLADVAGRPWVDGWPGSALAQAMRRIRTTTGLPFPGRHVVREFNTALTLVASGVAGAVVPQLALAAWGPPETVRIRRHAGIGARRLGVLYRSSRHEPTLAVRTVLQAMRAAAEEQELPGGGLG